MYQLVNQEEDGNNPNDRPRRDVVRRDLEGARLERLRSLRLSRAGYLGAMQRKHKSIDQLLLDPANLEAVAAERNSTNKIFTDYTKCCQDYRASLTENEVVELEEMLAEYNSVSRNREELERRVEEWLQDAQNKLISDIKQAEIQTSRSGEHGGSTLSARFEYSNTQQNVKLATTTRYRENDQNAAGIRPEGSIRSSKSSVRSEEAKFRRAKAEMEKKHRLELHEIERQRQNIEQKLEMVRIKQDVESKRAELQRKRELLKLQNEIELAELEEKL